MRSFALSLIVCSCILTCAFPAHGAVLSTPTDTPSETRISPEANSTELARLDVYSAGTFVYKNKKVQWFSVIEPDAKLIAALVVTPFAPHFNYEKVDRSEIPYQDETKQGNGVYVTFFYINSGTCSVEQVENLTCNFSSFICDIASKLQHLPGLSQVNVDEYVTLSKDKAFWCD